MNRLKIFTWHIHGSYLYYLSFLSADIFIPVREIPEEGYTPLGNNFYKRENIYEIPAEKVKYEMFDCIIFQSKKNYLHDQYEILSPIQWQLPKIYIEHDPPREHPTDTKHILQDPTMTLVHVTHFNNLMWDSGKTLTTVIEHGVIIPKQIVYSGKKNKGIVVINNIKKRGRRLGFDLFEKVKKQIPLDIVGTDTTDIGGLGEIPHKNLPFLLAEYRFFFNPIRYTSLGLSVIEAMMVGLPIVGFATTELPTTIENAVHGFIHTDTNYLEKRMHDLLENKTLASYLGNNAKKTAMKKFNIKRFVRDWQKVIKEAITNHKIIHQTKKQIMQHTAII